MNVRYQTWARTQKCPVQIRTETTGSRTKVQVGKTKTTSFKSDVGTHGGASFHW